MDANWRIGRGRPVMEIGKRVQVIGGLALTVCFASVALAQSDATVAPPAAEPAPEGFFSIIFSGGWVGFLIVMVLFGLSLTAAYLVFEHIMTLRRGEIMPDQLGEQVRQLLAAGRVGEADQACRAQPSFLSFIVLSGLAEIEGGWPAVEKALEDATAEQSARLFRKIEYLSVIGNIAPMVGLLGTVSGMIGAFQAIASATKVNPGDLAEDIGMALFTTAEGLIIAIPLIFAYTIFRERVHRFEIELQRGSQAALKMLPQIHGQPVR